MELSNKSEMIARAIEKKIYDGTYTGKLPSEQAVATEYDTARMTAAKALNLLVTRGLAVRVPFKGTYVKNTEERVIRVMGNEYFFNRLADYVPRRFPGYSVALTKDIDDAELMILTTFTPFEYESRLLPLPDALVERIEKEERHYPLATQLHRRGKHCYGMPALFSPFMLAYDRAAMRRVDPKFVPYELTLDKMFALQKKAASLNIPFISTWSAQESLFYSFLHNISESTPSRKDFQQAFDTFERLTAGDGGKSPLFQMVTRHKAAALQREGYDFDISPIPLINGTRYCALASEGLFVSRDADTPEILFDICEASVMPDFQRILTAGHHAIPIHRDCSLDSIGCPQYRDDFFFAEIPNLTFGRYRIPFPIQREIRFAFGEGALTKEGKEQILQVLDYVENESRRNRSLLRKMHYYTESVTA